MKKEVVWVLVVFGVLIMIIGFAVSFSENVLFSVKEKKIVRNELVKLDPIKSFDFEARQERISKIMQEGEQATTEGILEVIIIDDFENEIP